MRFGVDGRQGERNFICRELGLCAVGPLVMQTVSNLYALQFCFHLDEIPAEIIRIYMTLRKENSKYSWLTVLLRDLMSSSLRFALLKDFNLLEAH